MKQLPLPLSRHREKKPRYLTRKQGLLAARKCLRAVSRMHFKTDER